MVAKKRIKPKKKEGIIVDVEPKVPSESKPETTIKKSIWEILGIKDWFK